MTTARSFAALAAKINESRPAQNPRHAAGLSVAAWERQRKARRRAEWDDRVSRRSAIPTMQARPAPNPVADFFRAQNGTSEQSASLIIGPPQRAERGESAFQYYERKWHRFGTLGANEILNPYIDDLRTGRWSR